MNKPDDIVSRFYTTNGWDKVNGNTTCAILFEDLRSVAAEYVSKCRLRPLKYIPTSGDNIIDMASGPIQYREYLDYSYGFKKDIALTILLML